MQGVWVHGVQPQACATAFYGFSFGGGEQCGAEALGAMCFFNEEHFNEEPIIIIPPPNTALQRADAIMQQSRERAGRAGTKERFMKAGKPCH